MLVRSKYRRALGLGGGINHLFSACQNLSYFSDGETQRMPMDGGEAVAEWLGQPVDVRRRSVAADFVA